MPTLQAARAVGQQTADRVFEIAERRGAKPSSSSSSSAAAAAIAAAVPMAAAAPSASGPMPRTPGLASSRAKAAHQQHPMPLPMPDVSALAAAATAVASSEARAGSAAEQSSSPALRPRETLRPNPLAQAAPFAPLADGLSEGMGLSSSFAAGAEAGPSGSVWDDGEWSGSGGAHLVERSPSVFVEALQLPLGAEGQGPAPEPERAWEENAMSPARPPRSRVRSPSPQLSPLLRAASAPITHQQSQGVCHRQHLIAPLHWAASGGRQRAAVRSERVWGGADGSPGALPLL